MTKSQIRKRLAVAGITWAGSTVGYPGVMLGTLHVDGKTLKFQRPDDLYWTDMQLGSPQMARLVESLISRKGDIDRIREQRRFDANRKLNLHEFAGHSESLISRLDAPGWKAEIILRRA